MALNSGKKIVRWSWWDVIPMPDTVLEQVNTLGGDQPEDLIFTDRHGRLIGDGDNAIPGVAISDNADDTIPGVDFSDETDDAIPGEDALVELPGVDGDGAVQTLEQDPAPPNVTIDDLDTC
jgi:hypothetical protein